MAATLSWIHLSDRHIRSATANNAAAYDDALVLDLKQLLTNYQLSPDFLFFTGDLIFGRDKSDASDTVEQQFHQGAAFLDRIRAAVPNRLIPKSRVFIVPGNHDVNRTFVSKAEQEYLLFPNRAKSEIEQTFETINYDHEQYFRRLQDYRNFLRNNRYDHCCTDPDRLIHASQVDTDHLSVGIVGMNSAWPCGSDITRTGSAGLIIAARKQVERLLPIVKNCDCRFLLIHHPEAWYGDAERAELWRHLVIPKFHFSLHGHEHEVWYTEHPSHVTFAAGAAYDRADKPASYGVTSIDFDKRKMRHWIRTYSPENGGGWVARTIPNKQYEGDALILPLPKSIKPTPRKPVMTPRQRKLPSASAGTGRSKFKLVVFDLDGTLVEMSGTEYSWAVFWRDFKFPKQFRSHGVQLYERRIIDYQQWCDYCCNAFRLKNATRARFETIINKYCRLRPGALEVLSQLKENNVRMAIISGGVNIVFETLFSPSEQHYFSDVFANTMEFDTGGMLVRIKASLYDFHGKLNGVQHLCEKYGVPPDEVAFVGDAPNDRYVAKYVGKLIAVRSSSNLELAQNADKLIKGRSLRPLLDVLLRKRSR